MKRCTAFLAILFLFAVGLCGQSPLVVTYTDGDISTDMQSPWVGPSSCPGEMTVTIPDGNWITSVDLSYSMTAASGAWMSEQRSRLFSPTTGTGEAQYYQGNGAGGTMHYQRSGLTFANFVSGEVVFELHAGRTWGGSGCATMHNKVDNHTWTLNIHYGPIVDCTAPFGLTVSGLTNTAATIDWMQFGQTLSWDIVYGEPGFDPASGGTLITGIETTPFTVESLGVQTSYDLYIRANCGEDGLSEWSVLLEFETLPDPLTGHYTINQNLPTGGNNFNNFSDLAEFANAGGVSGHVVVHVEEGSGPYYERFVLNQLPNSSPENTLTINGNGETLEYRATTSLLRANIRLSNISHVTFNQLVIKALGEPLSYPFSSEYGYAVDIYGKAEHITFYQCKMISSILAEINWFRAVSVRSNANTQEAASHLTIEECLIVGGHQGIYLEGLPGEGHAVSNRIINNEIFDSHVSGIELSNQQNAIVEGNRIARPTRTKSSDSWIYGIYLRGQVHGLQLVGNRIYSFSIVPIRTAIGIQTILGTEAGVDAPMLIANNHISGFDNVTDMQYGIMLNTADNQGYVNVYHNTVLLDNPNYGWNGLIRCFHHSGANAVLDVRNNLFSYTTNTTGPKINMHISSGYNTLISDNNVFHRGSENTYRKNTVYATWETFATLEDWQAAGDGQFDQQSSDADPLVVLSPENEWIPSNPAIHGIGADLGDVVPFDIDGNPRSSTPSPGSHEFEPLDCLRPSELQATGITQHSAILGWTSNGNETAWQVEYGYAGFEQGMGTLIQNIHDNPHIVDNLTASTNYHFFVQALCGAREESEWAGPYYFETACSPMATPINENFDDASTVGLPPCWLAIVNSTSNLPTVGKILEGTGLAPDAFSPPFFIEMYNAWDPNADLFLVTPEIEGGIAGLQLHFMAMRSWTTSSVQIGTFSDDETFTLIEEHELTTGFQQYSVDFNGYEGTDVRIAFRHASESTSSRIYLDDILIFEADDFATVSGHVSNMNGEAVEGAKVTLSNWTATTDEAGFYEFEDVPPGSYELRAEAGGYAVEHLAFQVGEAEVRTHDLVFQYANPSLPFSPEESGTITYSGDAWQFRGGATDGRYVYKTMNDNKLYVFDLIDLENIVKVSSIDVSAAGMVFYHEHLYVFSGSTVQVYNTTNPANLQLLSTFVAGNTPRDMKFDGQTAWLLVWDNGMVSRLLEIDISDPASLTTVNTLWVTSGNQGSLYYTPQRSLLYIHGLSQQNPATVSIVDVSTAGEPVITCSETLGVVGSRMAVAPSRFYLAQNVALQGMIQAYSTTNPFSPELLTEQNLPDQALVVEISNITGTLMLHTTHPVEGHRLISMVYDADENKFYEGTGLERPTFGITAKYDFFVETFDQDDKEVGSTEGSSNKQTSKSIAGHYLIPTGQTSPISYSPPETPVIRIGKPEEEEEEGDECPAELTVSGYKQETFHCVNFANEGYVDAGLAIFSATEDDWILNGFRIIASGNGDDAVDIDQVTVVANETIVTNYPADDGQIQITLSPPVYIAEGTSFTIFVLYEYDLDIETYATDTLKTFAWRIPGGSVNAEPVECEDGEIKGVARLQGITIHRLHNDEGMYFSKLEEAVEETSDGGTITLCPLPHRDNVTLNKSLTITGYPDYKDETIMMPANIHLPIFILEAGAAKSSFKHFIISQEGEDH